MRVVHLLNHCRFGHGNVHAAVDLACAQKDMGFEVCIASGDGELTPLLAQRGIRHQLLDQEDRRPRKLLGLLWRFNRLLRDFKPDILHAHMMSGAVIGAVGGRLAGVPLVTTVHNAFDRHATLMRLGDRVITVSDPVADQMAARGIARAKLRTVVNGTLGAPRRDFFEPTYYEWPRPSITTICGLHDRKGVRDVIAAFDILSRRFPDLHLNIVGEGPNRRDYEALAATLPAHDRITFHGQLRDTRSVLATTDIFVLASLADPCPLVLPEAREAGCAIVATAVDGIPQALDDGAAGLLVPPQNATELAAAIASLLDSPERLAQMRRAAGDNIDFWSTARVARQTATVYAELLAEKGKGPKQASAPLS